MYVLYFVNNCRKFTSQSSWRGIVRGTRPSRKLWQSNRRTAAEWRRRSSIFVSTSCPSLETSLLSTELLLTRWRIPCKSFIFSNKSSPLIPNALSIYHSTSVGNCLLVFITALLRKDWELFLKSIVSSQYNFGQMVEYYIHLFIGITI